MEAVDGDQIEPLVFELYEATLRASRGVISWQARSYCGDWLEFRVDGYACSTCRARINTNVNMLGVSLSVSVHCSDAVSSLVANDRTYRVASFETLIRSHAVLFALQWSLRIVMHLCENYYIWICGALITSVDQIDAGRESPLTLIFEQGIQALVFAGECFHDSVHIHIEDLDILCGFRCCCSFCDISVACTLRTA